MPLARVRVAKAAGCAPSTPVTGSGALADRSDQDDASIAPLDGKLNLSSLRAQTEKVEKPKPVKKMKTAIDDVEDYYKAVKEVSTFITYKPIDRFRLAVVAVVKLLRKRPSRDKTRRKSITDLVRPEAKLMFKSMAKRAAVMAAIDNAATDNKLMGKTVDDPGTVADVTDDKPAEQPKKPWLIFDPASTTRRLFGTLVGVLTLYSCFAVPYELTFAVDSGVSIDGYFFFGMAVDLLFLTDIAVNFRTAIRREFGLSTIDDPKELRKLYLRGWFAPDLMSSIPFNLIQLMFMTSGSVPEDQSSAAGTFLGLLRIFRFFKLLRLLRMRRFKSVEKAIDSRTIGYIIRIVKLLLYYMLLTHYMACGFYLVAYVEGLNHPGGFAPDSWIVQKRLQDAPNEEVYLRAMYYALTITSTICFGDVLPVSMSETVYTMFTIFVGAMNNSYIVGNVFDLVASLNSGNARYENQMDAVKYYSSSRELPPSLKAKIVDHFEYMWQRNRFLDEEAIVGKLSSSLRTEVSLHQCREVVAEVPIFKGMDATFIGAIVKSLMPLFVGPGDMIITQGERGNELFILSKGQVQVSLRDAEGREKKISTLSKGAYFGEIALLSNEPRTASIEAITYCDLYMLMKKDFFKILRFYPRQRATIERTAKKRYQRGLERTDRQGADHLRVHSKMVGKTSIFLHGVQADARTKRLKQAGDTAMSAFSSFRQEKRAEQQKQVLTGPEAPEDAAGDTVGDADGDAAATADHKDGGGGGEGAAGHRDSTISTVSHAAAAAACEEALAELEQHESEAHREIARILRATEARLREQLNGMLSESMHAMVELVQQHLDGGGGGGDDDDDDDDARGGRGDDDGDDDDNDDDDDDGEGAADDE